MAASDRPPSNASSPPPRRRKKASASTSTSRGGGGRSHRPPRPSPSLTLRARLQNLSPRLRGLLWGLGALAGTLGVALAALLLGYGRHHSEGAKAIEIDWPAGLSSEDAAALL